jgi:hypothetical protein
MVEPLKIQIAALEARVADLEAVGELNTWEFGSTIKRASAEIFAR